MSVLGLNHFSLRTDKLEETRDFFVNVVGLEIGARPAFKFPGYWLYAQNQPILHLFSSGGDGDLDDYLGVRKTGDAAGALDHVALHCKDIAGFRKKFEALSMDINEQVVPDQKIHQIFVTEPNGITIELIFPM